MIRIVIADDHTLMREGLKRIFEGNDEITVVGEAIDGFSVISQVRKGGFDMLLLDLSMPGRSGIDLIRQIRTEAPKLPILVLTMYEEEQYAVRSIRAGAQGYLTKESAGDQLVNAIKKVASGRPYISMEVAEQLALGIMTPEKENAAYAALGQGIRGFQSACQWQTITDIGAQLHLSVKTVSTHKSRILTKMGMHSLAEIVQYAVTQNLLAPFEG